MKLPFGWKHVEIKDVAEVVTGSTPSTSDRRNYDGDYPFITPGDITEGRIITTSVRTVTKQGYDSVRQIPPLSTLVTCIGSSIGKTAISGQWAITNQQINAAIPSDIDPYFLFYAISKQSSQIKRLAGKQALPILPKSLFERIVISVPNAAGEQKKIGYLLSMWDTALEKKEKLIEAKEKRFKWLLGRLIKEGSKKGKWKKVKLGDITEVKKGQQLNVTDMVADGEYYVLNGGIEPSGFTNEWNTPENTITISEGGNSCGFVNFNVEKFWCGGHCYALNILHSEVLNKFLYHFLKAHEQSLMALRVGSGLPNIQRKDILNFHVSFPSLEQQNQIAEILNTARQEIDLIEKQAEACKKQKRGLMQKLLTGEIRVVKSEG